MKGCTIERAKPSNTIDIFPLVKKAAEEGKGIFNGHQPTEKMLKEFYIRLYLGELTSPGHFYYLAKRGRGFLGILHAVLVPGRWDGATTMMVVDFVFVVKNRRNYGVGVKLIDRLIKDAEEMGIKEFEFVCPDDQVEKWQKKRGAKKLANLMRVSL